MLADDHPIVCLGLATMIDSQSDMKVVAQASNGRQAIELFEKHRPDVTLIDLRMPEQSGVDAIRAIRATHPAAVFIVLTTYQGDEDIHKAMKAGAQGYLLKGMPHDDLLDAIRRVHSGVQYLPPSVRDTLANRLPSSELSPREQQILELIVKGLSNKQIADRLGITEGTVKWHVNAILGRLNVSDRTQAAVAALNRGIVQL
ncbi:MAG TPA: response regulator transcription factor [Bryobacteraceae bacterium]|nr:response regulator transcription factor [Bryobacteraceae bacterium]